MWNTPTDEELATLPPFYSSEKTPIQEKMIHMHFFIGGSDWYAAEYNPEERNFFGFVILNNDYQMAEWGYFSLDELCDIKVSYLEIDRDLHFAPTKAEDIPNIKKAQRW